MQKNVSFKSAIKPVSAKEYAAAVVRIGQKKSVAHPWTLNESVKADSAYSTGIFDCTLCGITDGENVLMMHLCPDVQSNHNFSGIFRYIAQNIDLKNPQLQGFLLGSQLKKISAQIYTKFVDFFKNYNIPFSEFKIGLEKTNVAYVKEQDLWLISSLKIDKMLNKSVNSETIINKMFQKSSICEFDEII